jgi:CRISPR-associated protein Csb1
MIDKFDAWLKESNSDEDVAALVMHQWLLPDEGPGAVIFPPTYAKPEDKQDWSGYNIDEFPDGSSVALLDSVGSQANRMEPVFAYEPYATLVPQIIIEAGDRKINLLEAGHRAADALVRFSQLHESLSEAFLALQRRDAVPLAKIAPTSIVFGIWDSRETQMKLPRIVRSVIRAYNVRQLHRSAQYQTIAGEILEGAEVEVTAKGSKAELGLAHVPSTWTHGGIQVVGEIRREAALSLSNIRALTATQDVFKLHRYILGLSFVAITARQRQPLREGCQLVLDPEHPPKWELVRYDGHREPVEINHSDVLAYASAVATDFGIEQPSGPTTFDADAAREAMGQTKAERKTAARRARRVKA